MAVAFRSLTSTTYASRTNTTVTAPSGLANDDILILHIFAGASGTAPTVTPPSGFTAVTGSPRAINDGSFFANVYTFWKRASGESGSYTATHSAGSSQAAMRAYSGCETSGSPIDVSSANSGIGSTTTATGITTTVANTVLLFCANDWQGTGTLSPPPGFTERFDSLIYEADIARAPTGETGNVTQANANSDAPPWAAFLVALKPPGAPGITGTLSQSVGTVTSSSTGTLAISGALSQTIGSVGSNADGALALYGDLSASIGPIAIDASGASGGAISGALDQSIGDVAMSAGGQAPEAPRVVSSGSSSWSYKTASRREREKTKKAMRVRVVKELAGLRLPAPVRREVAALVEHEIQEAVPEVHIPRAEVIEIAIRIRAEAERLAILRMQEDEDEAFLLLAS